MRRCVVRIVSRKALREATARHSEWGASLNAWYKITQDADWKNFAEVRNSWRNSDVVGRFVVFDKVPILPSRIPLQLNLGPRLVFEAHARHRREVDTRFASDPYCERLSHRRRD